MSACAHSAHCTLERAERLTSSAPPPSLPASALSSVVLPLAGGPSSSVSRPGRSTPEQPDSTVSRCWLRGSSRARRNRPCSKGSCGTGCPDPTSLHTQLCQADISGCRIRADAVWRIRHIRATVIAACMVSSDPPASGLPTSSRKVACLGSSCTCFVGSFEGRETMDQAERRWRFGASSHLEKVAVGVPDRWQHAARRLCRCAHPQVLETKLHPVQLHAHPAAHSMSSVIRIWHTHVRHGCISVQLHVHPEAATTGAVASIVGEGSCAAVQGSHSESRA